MKGRKNISIATDVLASPTSDAAVITNTTTMVMMIMTFLVSFFMDQIFLLSGKSYIFGRGDLKAEISRGCLVIEVHEPVYTPLKIFFKNFIFIPTYSYPSVITPYSPSSSLRSTFSQLSLHFSSLALFFNLLDSSAGFFSLLKIFSIRMSTNFAIHPSYLSFNQFIFLFH